MMPLLCLHELFLLVPHHQVVHLLSTARLPRPNHTTRGSQCALLESEGTAVRLVLFITLAILGQIRKTVQDLALLS